MSDAVLDVADLAVHFDVSGGKLRAVDGVSFRIGRGETLALVGESGCGKSSVGRAILRLVEPSAGRIVLSGEEITGLSRRRMKPHRQRVQMVFQDPYASLNPRQRIGSLVGEPLGNYGVARGGAKATRVRELLRRVGLPAAAADKYPHEFSGGQRQRVGIARALALEPHLIVADEPVSALDVSIQAQVLNLLIDLQNERGLAYLFISHDILVVEHISHRVAVMYLGKIVEIAEKRAIFAAPQHPYTEALFQSAPVPDPRRPRTRRPLAGEVPSPLNPPSGCPFHPRCPYAVDRCRSEAPALRETRTGHFVACHLR